jgi:hypothetical protein
MILKFPFDNEAQAILRYYYSIFEAQGQSVLHGLALACNIGQCKQCR